MQEPVASVAIDLSQQVAKPLLQSILPALESGIVIHFPKHAFTPLDHELQLMTSLPIDLKKKNISYHYLTQQLGGISRQHAKASALQSLLSRYAVFAHQLITKVCPPYKHDLRWGRTSFRPTEIAGRVTSKRQDDTRVHVDAFPATPVAGERILRVFCNINPQGNARVWHLGESFPSVAERFSSQLPRYSRFKAQCLQAFQVTKTLRTPYDHYMLHLHDCMKLDDHYQQQVAKHRIDFPANSSWIVFTDQVAHAALSGQFALEQTFYLPVAAMVNPEQAPLKQLERMGLI